MDSGGYPGRWGSETQATHLSEGEAGHNELMDGTMGDTQRSQTISTKLHQIAEQAREHPERIFTSLAHLLDVDLLRAAYCQTRKDGATGVDGMTAQEYAENLEENLTGLHARLRTQEYKALPVITDPIEAMKPGAEPIYDTVLWGDREIKIALLDLPSFYGDRDPAAPAPLPQLVDPALQGLRSLFDLAGLDFARARHPQRVGMLFVGPVQAHPHSNRLLINRLHLAPLPFSWDLVGRPPGAANSL